MLPSAFFRSWLVSESVLACFTLLNSFSTSACPVVKAVPLARKPSSGMTASTTMRVWTVNPETKRSAENFMSRMFPAAADLAACNRMVIRCSKKAQND